MKTLALISTLVFVPVAAGAQTSSSVPAAARTQAADARWNAWLGCWDLVLENSRDASPGAPPPRARGTQTSAASRPQVCVQPAEGGVTFSTRVGTQTPVEQLVVADGADHQISDAECNGTQRAEWSQNGRRLFAGANLTCAGDKGSRKVSGLAILGANGTWTDIQAVEIGGQETVRVRRYRRADPVPVPARGRADTPLSLDDVKEASGKVSPAALEAALVETGSIFALSGKELIALQDAGVPSSVTDLMIALSYPDRFIVERTARTDFVPPVPMFDDDPFLLGWSFGYPVWSDLYGFYSPLYGPYSPYFFSPFSYYYLRGYYPGYYGGGYPIVVDPGGGGGGSIPPVRPSGAGRVVDGSGYTRVRPREVDPTPSPRGASAGIASSGSPSTPSGSSGGNGGSVSTQGFSGGGGGGGGDTGRTAQPR